MRGGLKLEIDEFEVGSSTPGPQSGGGGFRAQARIPPGRGLRCMVRGVVGWESFWKN